MSQKTKSIADALKSTPKRQVPIVPETQPIETDTKDQYSESNSFPDERSEEQSSDSPSHHQAEETTSSEDLIARLSRLQASKDDEEMPENNKQEDQPHRATSRQRQQRSLGQDRQHHKLQSTRNTFSHQENSHFRQHSNRHSDEAEDTEMIHENSGRYPPRPLSPSRRFNSSVNEQRSSVSRAYQPQPFRTSRRGISPRPIQDSHFRSPHRDQPSSKFSGREYERDDHFQPPSRPSRQEPVTSRGRSVTSAQQNSRYASNQKSYDRQWSTDNIPSEKQHRTQNSAFHVVSSSRKEDTYPRRVSTEEDYPEDEDHSEPERRPRIPSSNENSIQFTGLSKTVVSKISKMVGIPSVASDVHETLKELSGNFIHDALTEASQVTDIVSSAELEPIIENQLGRQLEDLDQSFLNPNVFARWVKSIANDLQISLRNEAVLFLQQVLEFYLVELLTNARDVSEQARRSRVTVKDVLFASRLRGR